MLEVVFIYVPLNVSAVIFIDIVRANKNALLLFCNLGRYFYLLTYCVSCDYKSVHKRAALPPAQRKINK